MRAAGFFSVLLFAVLALPQAHAVTVSVVDLPVRDATQRILHARPDAPVAQVVFLPGYTGILGITADGSMTELPGRCAPFARNLQAFAAHGLSVALVDRTSDGRVRQFDDVREVVRHLRARDDVPTWIVGGSASTIATLEIAARLPADVLAGVVVFAPWWRDDALAAAVRRPTLVIYHVDDARVRPFVDALLAGLAAAPVRQRVGLAGGTNDGCGHHLFAGLDAAFVAATTGFIVEHSRALGAAGKR